MSQRSEPSESPRDNPVDRRQFLKLGLGAGLATAAGLVTACAGPATPAAACRLQPPRSHPWLRLARPPPLRRPLRSSISSIRP